jgi:ATP adenylyltransferase
MPEDQDHRPAPDTPRQLWAPWRMEYIGGPKPEGCVLCKALEDDRLIVHRGTRAFVIMNLYPYNNGHVMVAPIEHTHDFLGIDHETTLEIDDLIKRSMRAIRKAERPDGFNIGLNLGRAAGAGIDDHLHYHLVPRWNGDTNFLPVVAGHKTIGEAIEQTLKKIRANF